MSELDALRNILKTAERNVLARRQGWTELEMALENLERLCNEARALQERSRSSDFDLSAWVQDRSKHGTEERAS